jgi:large conductance mechanosensitive channel
LGIFDVGIVINAAVNLLITGIILFFIFVRPMNKLKAWNAPPVTPPPPPPEVALLTEIRDLLKQDKKP